MAEMTSKNKKMVERTRSVLLDVAANSEDAAAMEESLRLARKNGVLSKYASESSGLKPLPGDSRRRESLLGTLPELPKDNREAETAAAVSFLTVGGNMGQAHVGRMAQARPRRGGRFTQPSRFLGGPFTQPSRFLGGSLIGGTEPEPEPEPEP